MEEDRPQFRIVMFAASIMVSLAGVFLLPAFSPPPPPEPVSINYNEANSPPRPGFKLSKSALLSLDDLADLAKSVRDKGLKDNGLEGRSFRVVLDLMEDEAPEPGMALGSTYAYRGTDDTATLALTLYDATDGRSSLSLQRSVAPLSTQSEEDVTNARNQNEWEIAIGRDDKSPIGLFVPEVDKKGRPRGYAPLSEEVRHLPRAASKDGLRVQIDGDLVRTSLGSVISCETYERTAVFGEPLGGARNTCHINIRFRQVTFLDVQGHVLAKRTDQGAN